MGAGTLRTVQGDHGAVTLDAGPRPSWWRPGLRPGEPASGVPAWARFVEQVVALPAPAPEPGRGDGAELFAPAVAPFVRAAVARVDGPDLPVEVLRRAVRVSLAPRLAGIAARTLVLQLHRRRGTLEGRTPADRFARFVDHAATGAAWARTVEEFPVLGRLLAQECLQTAAAATELGRRWSDDRARVVADLLGGLDPGGVAEVRLGAGDRHHDGRTVAVLTCADGRRLVYRPRPVGLHREFAALAHRIGGATGLGLRVPRAVAGDGYGWVEHVDPAPCADAAAVDRFYRRHGVLLALLHALDGTDAHHENVIAAGEHPVLVDVETLLHPSPVLVGHAGADPAHAALMRSVDRTALLPRRLLGEHGAMDLSGVGGGAGGIHPHAGPRWLDAGTDTMRLVRGPVEVAATGGGRPRLDGEPVDVRGHRAALLAGFAAGYDAIVAARDGLLAPDGPLARLAAHPIRVITRNTRDYARMLDESTHPDVLRDAGDRERLLARIGEYPPAVGPVEMLPREVDELWRGDVPLFVAHPDAADLHTADGERLAGALPGPPLAAVTATLRRMGPADRDRQAWVIRAALALSAPAGSLDAHRGVVAAAPVAVTPPEQCRFVAAACAIADRLVALAEHDDHRANWLGLQHVHGYRALLPMGAALADGYPGVALFLAQLADVTGLARYADLARRAVAPLPGLIGALATDRELVAAVGCGGFHGMGGVAYALARLARLLDSAELRAATGTAVELTRVAAAAGDGDPTVATGLAGAVAALRAVHVEVAGAGAAEVGAELGSALRRVSPPPGGFLFGGAGVRWARGEPDDGDVVDPRDLGWCSGRAGEVLAARPPDAVDLVAATGPLRDHGLCHGDAGVLDVLVALDAPGAPVARRAGARLLARLAAEGAVCGTADGVPTPGLLDGLAGIGHVLLRLGHPDRVPSLVLLQPATPAAGTEPKENR